MINQKKILSIETSGNICSVSLSSEFKILSTINIEGNVHDRMLATLVKDILNEQNISILDIHCVALSAGPGSYTGLRIGSAFVKGLCHNGSLKFISVPTLTAFAFSAIKNGYASKYSRIVSVIQSHKEMFYIQEFSSDINSGSEIEILSRENIMNLISDTQCFVGPAARFFDEHHAMQIQDDELMNRNQKIFNYNSEIIAHLANQYYIEEKFADADDFVPLYVQEFVPKTQERKR